MTVRPRQVLVLGTVACAAAAAGVVVATLAGALAAADGTQLLLSVVLVGAVVYIASAVRRADAKALRLDAKIRGLDARLGQAREAVADHAAGLSDLTRLIGSADEASRKTHEEIRTGLAPVHGRIAELRDQLAGLRDQAGRLEETLEQLGPQVEKIGATTEETGPTILASLGEDRAERAAMARRIEAIAGEMASLRAKIEHLGSAALEDDETRG